MADNEAELTVAELPPSNRELRDTEASDLTSTSENSRETKLAKIARQLNVDLLRRKLHLRYPNVRFFQEPKRRDYSQKRDERDNRKTQVPSSEALSQRALWGVEIFGPLEIDSLYTSLDLLGWNTREFGGYKNSARDWISEHRMYGLGGLYDLGYIGRIGQDCPFRPDLYAPMPDSAYYMSGIIYQVSPSLTAVVLCFVLKDEHSNKYELALNTARTSTNEKTEKSSDYNTLRVEALKQRAVNSIRLSSKNSITDWFKLHLPGHFSRNSQANCLPTAELITTTVEPILSQVPVVDRFEKQWVRLLRGTTPRRTWIARDFEGLSFYSVDSEKSYRNHTLINLQTSLVTDEYFKHHGGRNTPSYVVLVNEHFGGVLVGESILAFLTEASSELRRLRERLYLPQPRQNTTLKAIDQIKIYFDQSVGLPVMISELSTENVNRGLAFLEWAEFTCSSRWKNTSIKLIPAIRRQIPNLASKLIIQERETREHLEQLSTVLSIRENVRTQRRMECLTKLTLIIATLSLAIATLSLAIALLSNNNAVVNILSNIENLSKVFAPYKSHESTFVDGQNGHAPLLGKSSSAMHIIQVEPIFSRFYENVGIELPTPNPKSRKGVAPHSGGFDIHHGEDFR